MKLKDYMKKIEGIYKDAAPEYIKVMQKYRQAKEDIVKTRSSTELTHEGKTKRIQALEAYRNELKAEMDKIANEADAQALKVRKTVDDNFYSTFYATPAALDMQAMELLKSGILNDKELVNLAASFKGNATMQRICGSYMEKSTNEDTARMGRAMKYAPQDTHMRCVDSIISAGRACVGIGTQSGPEGAETFLNKFDSITAETYANTPDVEG